jgi:hypothetical protein
MFHVFLLHSPVGRKTVYDKIKLQCLACILHRQYRWTNLLQNYSNLHPIKLASFLFRFNEKRGERKCSKLGLGKKSYRERSNIYWRFRAKLKPCRHDFNCSFEPGPIRQNSFLLSLFLQVQNTNLARLCRLRRQCTY